MFNVVKFGFELCRLFLEFSSIGIFRMFLEDFILFWFVCMVEVFVRLRLNWALFAQFIEVKFWVSILLMFRFKFLLFGGLLRIKGGGVLYFFLIVIEGVVVIGLFSSE